MEKNKRQVPRLRFPGFNDAWEQRKAKEIFISTSEKNHAYLPVISATQDKGMVYRDDVGIDIKYDKKTLAFYKLVRSGQFVIHLRSFQGGFAFSEIEGITSPAYTVIDFKSSHKHQHASYFWKEIFKSEYFIKRLDSIIYGIRDGRSISYHEFANLNFIFPTQKEQTAIGDFFRQLDAAIASHQRKA